MRAMYGILLGALFALGQQPPVPASNPEPSGTVFSVTSTLVQVDAVVTAGKGRSVPDLTANDFQVLIDGKRQQLTQFWYVPLSVESRMPEPVHTAAKTVLIPLPPPSAPLRAEDVRRTIVLMVDDLGLAFESMAFVRSSLLTLVENQIQPGDLVAVIRTGAGSGALEQFTSEKRVLVSLIDGLRWNPNGRSGISLFEPLGMYSDLAQRLSAGLPNGAESSPDVRFEIRGPFPPWVRLARLD
jgi:VWFA-related protein